MKRPIVLSRTLKESLVAKQMFSDRYGRSVTASMKWHWNHKPYASGKDYCRTVGVEE